MESFIVSRTLVSLCGWAKSDIVLPKLEGFLFLSDPRVVFDLAWWNIFCLREPSRLLPCLWGIFLTDCAGGRDEKGSSWPEGGVVFQWLTTWTPLPISRISFFFFFHSSDPLRSGTEASVLCRVMSLSEYLVANRTWALTAPKVCSLLVEEHRGKFLTVGFSIKKRRISKNF